MKIQGSDVVTNINVNNSDVNAEVKCCGMSTWISIGEETQCPKCGKRYEFTQKRGCYSVRESTDDGPFKRFFKNLLGL